MDQGTREAGRVETGPSDGQRSPEEIRRDIEHTRADLGDTVEALAQKADVKSRAKERIDHIKGSTPGAQHLGEKAQQNPLPFAVGGALVAGFLLGKLTSR